jgi:hypothetical protein
MLALADSQGIQSPPAASPGLFPGWARTVNAPETEAEAAFLAGAALARLDAIVRDNPPWAGVFRQRLALSAAAACVARAGRAEDEARLRDAFHLRRGGGDPGPAGKVLLAWRELCARPTRQWRFSLVAAAEVLGVAHDEALQETLEAADACVANARPAPFAAARVFAVARGLTSGERPSLRRRGGEGEALAAWLVDAVLAERLNWPFALPMLAAQLPSPAARPAMSDLADAGGTTRVLFAYAQAASQACDLSAELGRRAQKLFQAAPKLRAKGAGAALRALLDEDSLSAATPIGGLSERGARRLYDRLVALGAIRELTGRTAFRLYGL